MEHSIAFFFYSLIFTALLNCHYDRHKKRNANQPRACDPAVELCNQQTPNHAGANTINPQQISDKNFSSKNFSGQLFQDMDLIEANFESAILINAKFINCNLQRANFSNVDANGTTFLNSSLEGANLRGANFGDYANRATRNFALVFGNTSLKGAEIDGKTIINTTLTQAVSDYGMVYSPDLLSAPMVLQDISGIPVSIEIAQSGANALTNQEKARVIQYLNEFSKLDIEADPGSIFDRLFKGRTSRDIIPYLDESINYIIFERSNDADDAGTIAGNFGNFSWYKYANDTLGTNFKLASKTINGKQIIIDRPDIGIITLGPVFVDLSTSIVRLMTTLVHEARHSHCENRPSDRDLRIALLRSQSEVQDKSCNHIHAICPAGHNLAGKPACDDHILGSYVAGAVFLETYANKCKNCRDVDLQFARLSEKEVKSRLLGAAKL